MGKTPGFCVDRPANNWLNYGRSENNVRKINFNYVFEKIE
jgi:hypothetical protein